MKRSKLFALAAAVAATSGIGIAAATSSGAVQQGWFNTNTGEVNVAKMPARIPMGTDLFPSGVGYLESRNFKEPANNGPFLVYESTTAASPSYWYYKGVGVVAIGSTIGEGAQATAIADGASSASVSPVTSAVASAAP